MDSNFRGRVEAWLRYGEDLKVGPYYKGRAPSGKYSIAVSENDAITPKTEISIPAAAVATESSISGLMPKAPQVPQATSTKSSPALPVIPIGTVSSLFDECIEGDTLERIRE